MTINNLKEHIGQTRLWSIGKLRVEVTVKDTRSMYGRIDLLITPIAGQGQQWVEISSCRPVEQSTAQNL